MTPLVSEELFEHLVQTFSCEFRAHMSHREMDQMLGRQEVIGYLRRLYQEGATSFDLS